MKKFSGYFILLLLLNILVIAANFLPFILFAADKPTYQLLEPSVILDNPVGTPQPANYGLKQYLQTGYLVLFVLIICVTVFYLIIGGLEYILSDIPNVKLDGLSKLKKALTGLAIALFSYLLLKLINPDLLNFRLDLNAL